MLNHGIEVGLLNTPVADIADYIEDAIDASPMRQAWIGVKSPGRLFVKPRQSPNDRLEAAWEIRVALDPEPRNNLIRRIAATILTTTEP
jgi:hypothetical protein